MPGSFFDSNVLLYLASADKAKAERAEALVAGGGGISVQVLNEIANVARRKMGLSWPDTRTFLWTLRELLTVHPVTVDIHDAGLALADQYQLSVYDSMVAAAAIANGYDTLLSEDMLHGMKLNHLRIANPFRASPTIRRRKGPVQACSAAGPRLRTPSR